MRVDKGGGLGVMNGHPLASLGARRPWLEVLRLARAHGNEGTDVSIFVFVFVQNENKKRVFLLIN